MDKEIPQPDQPSRGPAGRVKAPRHPRPLTFAPPPVKGQLDFDFSIAEEKKEPKAADEESLRDVVSLLAEESW